MGMLTQLSTVKARLAISTADEDLLLTNVIKAVSARFDIVCNRRFACEIAATEEFSGDETEIRVGCYPIESVSLFELKASERAGWVAVSPDPDFIIRRNCIVSLYGRLAGWRYRGRVTYAGGYILPGDEVKPGQTPLPADIENACVEQVAYWYQNRSTLGLTRVTDSAGLTTVTLSQDLLASVQSTLDQHVRWLV